MKTRTKQIEKLISDVNYYLKAHNVTDESNDLFLCVTNSLIIQDIYKGFNYYTRHFIEGFNPLTGKDELFPIDVTCTKQECQFLQIL